MIPDLADADFISVEDELIINILPTATLSKLEQLRLHFESVMNECVTLEDALKAIVDGMYVVIFEDEHEEDDVTWIPVNRNTGNVM